MRCRLRLRLIAVFPGPVCNTGAHALEMGTDSDRCFALLDTDVVTVRRWRPIFSIRLTGKDCCSEKSDYGEHSANLLRHGAPFHSALYG